MTASHRAVVTPQVSKSQYEKVCGYVQAGVDEGARLVTGGNRPAHLPKGFFLQPTVSTRNLSLHGIVYYCFCVRAAHLAKGFFLQPTVSACTSHLMPRCMEVVRAWPAHPHRA